MASKTLLTTIVKLNDKNWHTWSKEAQSYLLLEDLWDTIDPSNNAPTTPAALTRDKKAYAHLYFLIEPESRAVIAETQSGHSAWGFLKAEYQKDSPSTRMNLRQQFYSLTHIPTSGVTSFINSLTSIVRQLEAINHKPSKDEITDKLLMGLHSSFSAVRTTLALRSPEPSIKDIITALKQFEDNELSTSSSAHFDLDPYIKTETTLYAGRMRGSGGGGGGYRAGGDDGFDWGNTKRNDGVCWRCGRPKHIAQNCIFDMPKEVKDHIMTNASHSAHIAVDTNEPVVLSATVSDTSGSYGASSLRTDTVPRTWNI